MRLTLNEAAIRLGKSVRQVRYLVKNNSLPAKKIGGRWMVESGDLPLSDGQQQAVERKERQLRAAVERGLGIDGEARSPRYSVRDLKAFQIALPLYQRLTSAVGDDHPASQAMRRVIELLSRGCHRFERGAKAESYHQARDAASQAVCELVLTGNGELDPLVDEIEQELMAAFAGLLQRLERRRPR